MPRLFELLARNMGISRTAATRLIERGSVSDAAGTILADRKLILTNATDGQPRASAVAPATIRVDGEVLPLWESATILLNKPVGVVTALRDSIHPTAYELLRGAPLHPELRPVGRLDLDTTGLLLWTTEGGLIQRLTHPKRRVPRTYHAALARTFSSPPANFELEDGYRPQIVELRQLPLSEAHPALREAANAPILASVTIIGGAYHEVRRLFAALGSHVLQLCRTRFGSYELPGDLPSGAWRMVHSPDENR